MTEPSLATLLRIWRERAFLTQEQLARGTGLGVRTIRRLESDGMRRPRTDSLRLLADALKLDDEERGQLIAAARAADGPAFPDPPAAVPRQLPADVAGFVGRAGYLRELDALLDGSASTVVISAIAGAAGVGKTALAVHWAHRVAERFPDGQLYVNLRGFDPSGVPVEPAVVLRGFLEALDVSPSRFPGEVDGLAGLFRSMLSGRRVLVVLDNARDAGQVRPLLPGARGCLAVVTSRNRLTGLVAGAGARPLTLDLLSTVEARELLAASLGAGPVAAAPDAVDEIITACARLPLALAIVAARAAVAPASPLPALAAELGAARTLDALDTGDALTDVRTVFSWSYRDLSGPAARLFRLLGLHPGPDISVPAAASLAGAPVAATRAALTELARAHLVAEPAPGRYAFHDLLGAYAGELAQADAERGEATHRLYDHLLHTAHAAATALGPHREPIPLHPLESGATAEAIGDHREALAWFVAEHQVLTAAVDGAARAGLDRHAWQLAWAMADFLFRQGRWHDMADTQRTAIDATGRLADTVWQTDAHRNAALAYTQLGSFDDADLHLRQGLALCRDAGDETVRANIHHSLSQVREKQGDLAAALGHAREALDLYRAAGQPRGEANVLNTLGWLYQARGDLAQARAVCEQVLALCRESGDRYGEAATSDSLGTVHRGLGHHDLAVGWYRRAIELTRDLGERYYEAETLDRLGDTYDAVGRGDAAREAWTDALSILDELRHPDADRVRAKLTTTR